MNENECFHCLLIFRKDDVVSKQKQPDCCSVSLKMPGGRFLPLPILSSRSSCYCPNDIDQTHRLIVLRDDKELRRPLGYFPPQNLRLGMLWESEFVVQCFRKLPVFPLVF